MIWLVRHGQSELNAAGVRHRREDSPLTELGLVQAGAVSIPVRPFRILTSPLLRAYATACVIAVNHGCEAPIVVDALTERDWGQECDIAAKPVADLLCSLERDTVVVTHAGIIKGLLGTDITPDNGAVIAWP